MPGYFLGHDDCYVIPAIESWLRAVGAAIARRQLRTSVGSITQYFVL